MERNIEHFLTVTNEGSYNFQSHFHVGVIGMTDWIRESVIIMVIGQKPQVYLHFVRHSTCVSNLEINHTHLYDCNNFFFAFLYLFWHSCSKIQTSKYVHFRTVHTLVLFVETYVQRNYAICGKKGWWYYNVLRRSGKPVWMHKKILALTGRECVIIAFSFPSAIWSMVSSNPYYRLHIISNHNQQPLVYDSVCLTWITEELTRILVSFSTVKSKYLDHSLKGFLRLIVNCCFRAV